MMSTKILGLDILTEFDFNSEKEETRINTFIQMLQSFNLIEAESSISEAYEDKLKMNKYHILAGLKEVLDKFITEGDTELTLKRGYCSKVCYDGQDEIYQLIGNHSGNSFDFGIMEEGNKISNFHGCMNFVDEQGNASKKYQTMCVAYALKMAQFVKPTE